MRDFVFALRQLRRSPAFTVTAILAIALGIGANTAIFSVVNSVILKPLPFKDPEGLVMIWEHNFQRDKRQNVVAPADYLDWKAQAKSFSAMSAVIDVRANLIEGEPEQIRQEMVEASFFPMLGAQTVVGRTFSPEEDRSEAAPVAVLSHDLWVRKFNADPNIVGRKINMDSKPATVIGVLSADFAVLATPVDLWTTGFFRKGINYRVNYGRFMRLIARRNPGVSTTQAQAELSGIAQRLEQEHPDFNKGWGVNIVPLHEQFAGPIRTPLMILLGAVGFVLLIACANVANLLLARAAAREKEVAIRASLGAGRGRLIRQFLVESLTLAAIGGALGVLLGYWTIKLIKLFGPADVYRLQSARLDWTTVGYCAAATVLASVTFGLAPALAAAREDVSAALKDSGRGSSSRAGNRLRGVLIVAETALCLVLLIGAGLMLKSFVRMTSVDPGFDPSNVLTFNVAPTSPSSPEHNVAFFVEAIDRLKRIPGVRDASAITWLPFSGPGAATSFSVVGRPAPPPGQSPTTDVRVIHPDFFRVLGIPLKRGRFMESNDYRAEAPRKYIVNESMAKLVFPNEDPLGKQLVVAMGDDKPGEIIGIVGDVKFAGFDGEVRPMVYYPHPQLPIRFMTLVVKTSGDPRLFAAPALATIREMAPTQAVTDMKPMTDWMAASVAQTRFQMSLLIGFASLALILAAVGLYGVVAYFVQQRTQEIGIRMALGAQPSEVSFFVIRQGLQLVAVGAVLGLAGALALNRFFTELLFETPGTDWVTYGGVTTLLLLIALAACYGPARRATRIDPVNALR
ncbi:MAG: ABC transporter permease [Bryobacteraceae bacterium]